MFSPPKGRFSPQTNPHVVVPGRPQKKRAHRETITRNSAVPVGVAFSVDENGTLIPDKRAAEPTESPELSSEDEVRYAQQYDSYGNWTQQTVNHSSSPDKPSYVCHRKITYY